MRASTLSVSISESHRSYRSADVVALLAVAPVLLLPLLIGGVHPEVAVAFASFELLVLAAWVGLGSHDRRPTTVSWLALPFVLGALLTMLEVLPLPATLVSWLVPAPADLRSFVIAGLPDTVRTDVLSVISMDPPETKAALARLIGAAAMFVVVSNAARRRDRARLIWRFVVVAASVIFVVAVGHAFLDTGPWGIFAKHSGIISAPIVNQNHQSKVFAAFAMLCFGRAFACRDRREAIVTGVVGVVCGIAVALTLSRGGMLALCAAAVLGAALLWRARRVEREHADVNHLALPALAAAMALIVVGSLLIADRAVLAEVESLRTDSGRIETSKLALWQPALGLLDEHFFAGTGNNAFAMAFTARSLPHTMYDGELTFSHVENIVVGTLVEHGAMFGGLLVLVGLLIGLRLLQSLTSTAEVAAVPAVFVLVIGDVVDFALESGAGIAMMSLALGLCAAALPRSGRRLRTAPAVATVLIAAAVLVAHAPSAIRDWRYRLDRELNEAKVAQRLPLLQHILSVRPFDGYICSALAVDARHRRQPREALQWANRAINLWPTLPAGHIEAARALVATGRTELAMLEYRVAATASNGATIGVLQEVFARTSDAAFRRRALPEGAWALSMLCRSFVREKRTDDARLCAEELAARPDATDEHRVEPLRLALNRGDTDAVAELLAPLRSGTQDGVILKEVCRSIALLGGFDAAMPTVQELLRQALHPAPTLSWLLGEQLRLERYEDALITVVKLRSIVRTVNERDQLDRQEAELYRRIGQLEQRVVVLRRLVARHPADTAVLAQLGLAEHEAGQPGSALRTWRRLVALNARGPDTTALAQALGLSAN